MSKAMRLIEQYLEGVASTWYPTASKQHELERLLQSIGAPQPVYSNGQVWVDLESNEDARQVRSALVRRGYSVVAQGLRIWIEGRV